jgi:hypothetical protein
VADWPKLLVNTTEPTMAKVTTMSKLAIRREFLIDIEFSLYPGPDKTKAPQHLGVGELFWFWL